MSRIHDFKQFNTKDAIEPMSLARVPVRKNTTQLSPEARRLRNALKQFSNDLPLFEVQDSVPFDNCIRVRMHIYVGTYRNSYYNNYTEPLTVDKYIEVTSVVRRDMVKASADIDLGRWVADAINDTRKKEPVRNLTIKTRAVRVKNDILTSIRFQLMDSTKGVRLHLVRFLAKGLGDISVNTKR